MKIVVKQYQILSITISSMITFIGNLALYRPAWQYNQHYIGDDKYHASNAVDGRKSILGASGGQCVISGNHQQIATWRVDLQGILSINYITIYYRTENAAFGKQLSIFFKDFVPFIRLQRLKVHDKREQ
jgi:hypothetical protein